jgi:hypothetical protein
MGSLLTKGKTMERTYKVTYAIDSLDPSPTIKKFDDFDEMQDWISNAVNYRIRWSVNHSPYPISKTELKAIEEQEYSLINIEEL